MKNYLIIGVYTLTILSVSAQFQRIYHNDYEELDDIDFFLEGAVMTGRHIDISPAGPGIHNGMAMYVRDDKMLQWSKKYSVNHQGIIFKSFFNDIQTLTFNHKRFAITGATSWISSQKKTDMFFSVVDADGSPSKSSLIGTSEYDEGLVVKSFKHSRYGNIFFIAGETHPSPNPNPDNWNIIVAILDDSGTLIRSAVYDAPGRQAIRDVEITKDGYILVGETKISGHTCDGDSIAALILALDHRLNPTWNRVIDITPKGQFSKDRAVGIAIRHNEVWVAGGSNELPNAFTDSFLIKLDLSGNVAWLRGYDTFPVRAFKQQLDASGNIENIILTRKGLISLDASGNFKWRKAYLGKLEDLATYPKTFKRGFAICGTKSSASTISDGYFIRANTTGASESLCESKEINPTVKQAFCVRRIPISIVGRLQQEGTKMQTENLPLTKYDCQYNVFASKQSSNQGILYPNPATNQLTIDGTIELEDVIIFSLDGTLMIRTQPENNTLDISDLPKGMYILHLIGKDGSIQEHTFRKE